MASSSKQEFSLSTSSCYVCGKMWELIQAYRKCDPAAKGNLEVLFLYPGVKALVFHRIAHALFRAGVPFFPRAISEFSRFLTGIDIHPGAQLGRRVIIDHGMGVVIGETSVIEDDVIIYQGVTLGGTTLDPVKRHPTIRKGSVIGAGSKVLGNIIIGEGTRVGANSVVIHPTPPHSTAVGIPARVISTHGVEPGHELQHDWIEDQ